MNKNITIDLVDSIYFLHPEHASVEFKMNVDMDLFSNSSRNIENSYHQSSNVGRQLGPYILLDVLGQGQYGCVQLAIHSRTQERVAIKTISKSKTFVNQVKKEILIHNSITRDNPKNIIKFITMLEDENSYCLVLEWAGGGELFDLIEPDVGIADEMLVHYYFSQILDALELVHNRGVAHRDVKPENLLLDDNGNLKLGDFGLSTLYMHEGKERMLNTPCGSPIYMAPEVIAGGEYNGPAADIWSCGIVLYAMLFGATPWDEASINSQEFLLFKRESHELFNIPSLEHSIYSQISDSLRELLLGMLTIEWQFRWTINKIRNNEWVSQINRLSHANISTYLLNIQRKQQNMNHVQTKFNTDFINPDNIQGKQYTILNSEICSMSQPSEIRYDSETIAKTSNASIIVESYADNLKHEYQKHHKNADLYFSQQISVLDSSPLSQTVQSHMNTKQDGKERQLMKHFAAERLLRFYTCVSHGGQKVLHVLCRLLESFLIPFKFYSEEMKIQFATVDSRKRPLSGHIQQRHSGTRPDDCSDSMFLIAFLKTKGDIIEFKRFFKLVHTYMIENCFVLEMPLLQQ